MVWVNASPLTDEGDHDMATRTAHTPGPWSVVDGSSVEDAAGFIVATSGYHEVSPGDRASMVLIAAAPDLLEATQTISAVISRFGEWDDGCFYYNRTAAPEMQTAIRLLEAAIAKATGQ